MRCASGRTSTSRWGSGRGPRRTSSPRRRRSCAGCRVLLLGMGKGSVGEGCMSPLTWCSQDAWCFICRVLGSRYRVCTMNDWCVFSLVWCIFLRGATHDGASGPGDHGGFFFGGERACAGLESPSTTPPPQPPPALSSLPTWKRGRQEHGHPAAGHRPDDLPGLRGHPEAAGEAAPGAEAHHHAGLLDPQRGWSPRDGSPSHTQKKHAPPPCPAPTRFSC